MKTLLDANNKLVEVGDVIYRAIFSGLTPHIVLGFTDNQTIISVKRTKSTYYKKNTVNSFEKDINTHNSKLYVNTKYLECIIKEKNTTIPKILLPYVRH